MSCPFNQTLGSCGDAYVTINRVQQAHPHCETRNQFPPHGPRLSVRIPLLNLRIPFVSRHNPSDDWDMGSPHYSPISPTTNGPPPALPSAWNASTPQTQQQSHVLHLVTQYRRQLYSAMLDLVPTTHQMRASAPPNHARLQHVLTWAENLMASIQFAAGDYVERVQAAESQVVNFGPHATIARAELARITQECSTHTHPFTSADTWHRRFTDLFRHLNTQIDYLNAPSQAPAQTSALLPPLATSQQSPQPTHHRRGAISLGRPQPPLNNGPLNSHPPNQAQNDDIDTQMGDMTLSDNDAAQALLDLRYSNQNENDSDTEMEYDSDGNPTGNHGQQQQ
jgi:hypothetical protein